MRQTSKEYFRAAQILFFALIASMLFFSGITLVLILSGNISSADPELDNIFLVVVAVFVAGGFTASNMLFKKKLQEIKEMKTLLQKMPFYRGALILRYALIEGPAFLAITMSFVTGNLLFLAVAALIIAYFLTLKPTPARAIKELELSYNDQQLIENPKAIIADV